MWSSSSIRACRSDATGRSGGASDLGRGLNRAVRELNAYRADADHPCDIKTSLRVSHADTHEASAGIYEELLADGIEHAHGGYARCR